MSTHLDGAAVTEAAMASVSSVVEYYFEQRPHCARRVGRHEFDAQLPDVCARSVTDLDRMRATATSQLSSLPDSAAPELRADLGTCLRLLEAERFQAAELGQVHPGPLERLAETDASVYLRNPYAPLAERVAALDAHLARVPQFLKQATRTLGGQLPAGDRLRGIELARAQAAHTEDMIRQLATDHPDLALTRLTADASAAAAACTDFADAIAATTPTRALLGPEFLAAFLRATEGIDHPVTDLLDEAQAEVDAVISALDSVAGTLGVANRQTAVELMTDHVSRGSVLETLGSTIQRVQDFWIGADVVSVETVNPFEIRRAGRPGAAAEVVFAVSGPLEQVRQPHILHVPDLPDSAGPASIRRQYLNDPMLEVIAVHETFAGHYVHTEACFRGPSVIRTCVRWSAGFSEGWAHYAEELAVEHGLADGRPLVEVAQLKSALDAATRLLIFLSVHMGRWTFGEAVSRAVLLCNWSPQRAAREVLATTSDESTAMYTLGKLRIREWRRTAGTGMTRRELKSFHDRILQCGFAPLSTVWQYYLDGQQHRQSAPTAATHGSNAASAPAESRSKP